ncbi:alpha/beta hydrolase [Glycomyces luteolus]|uniref:Alpha/beta hydrolase n=1 Tax=Glycomyces luteolus TaxID=2670330 RepID=A0A9X3T417_9ACTN|nr:alpha/beta hydrolase [Glycomyces luteolus]MDA1360535.1 alpha/beta hydrolase [Glycomyces luteolus]
MSELTWEHLRDLDCGAIRTLGDTWKAYVEQQLAHTERLRTEVIEGHLSAEHFESDTATQVREQIGMTADRYEDDLSDYASTRIATTLFEVADAFEKEQNELKELVPLIEQHDFEIEGPRSEYDVNLSGDLHQAILTLNPPQWLCDMCGVQKPDGFWDLDTIKVLFNGVDLYGTAIGLAGQYQDWLRAVMSRAHDADDEAAAALSEMRENPTELPPRLGATYDDLVDDYKEGVTEEVAGEAKAIAEGTSGMSPEQVNQWWEGLSESERQALIEEHPEWVGPVDGIPTESRDTANRTLLDNDIDRLGTQIAAKEQALQGMDPESEEYEQAKEELDGLKGDRDDLANLQDRITNDDGTPALAEGPEPKQPYYLLGFGTQDSGRAIVSVGNPDTADNVNTLVPGTTSNLTDVDGLINRAETMQSDAQLAAPGASNATVMWLGYDAPDTIVPEAMQERWADGASNDLERFTKGLDATGQPNTNHTLTGHSYGTTVIGHAASQDGVNADNIVFVASPGVGTDTASALGVDEDNVWSTTNSLDPIQLSPDFLHGANPAGEDFGGNTFHSDTGAWNANNHSTYWDDTNMAGRETLADIATGQR